MKLQGGGTEGILLNSQPSLQREGGGRGTGDEEGGREGEGGDQPDVRSREAVREAICT